MSCKWCDGSWVTSFAAHVPAHVHAVGWKVGVVSVGFLPALIMEKMGVCRWAIDAGQRRMGCWQATGWSAGRCLGCSRWMKMGFGHCWSVEDGCCGLLVSAGMGDGFVDLGSLAGFGQRRLDACMELLDLGRLMLVDCRWRRCGPAACERCWIVMGDCWPCGVGGRDGFHLDWADGGAWGEGGVLLMGWTDGWIMAILPSTAWKKVDEMGFRRGQRNGFHLDWA